MPHSGEGDGSEVGASEHVEGIHSVVQDEEMGISIRGPGEGRFGSHQRTLETITRHPQTDAILADQLLGAETPAAEALGRDAARSMGRGRAEGLVFLQDKTLALIAKRAGHKVSSAYYSELWEIFVEAEADRRGELAASAVQNVKSHLDELLAERRCPEELDDWLEDCAELDLGRLFPGDPRDALPIIVGHVGFHGDEARQRIGRLLPIARRAQNAASDAYARAHRGAWSDYRRRRRRRAEGIPLFSTYLVNTKTWRVVEEEEAEVADIAQAEREAINAAMGSAEGCVAFAKRQGGNLGTMLLEAFTAAYQSQRLPIPAEGMAQRCAAACGRLEGVDLIPMLQNVIETGRMCRSGSEAETAFMRLLATEGIAAPGAAVPAVVAEPSLAPVAPLSKAAAREAEMDALTHVPGLVGDLVDWMTATSMKPNRTLAFAAALVLVGTLAGRLYETETSLRTNIYALGLAPSGFGKDHARSCLNIIVEEARCGAWVGGSKIASGTAMRRRVEDHPAIMWIIDEFGGTMKQMSDVRNVHNSQICDLLLELFESAGDVFRGTDYAGEQGRPIHNPNVSIYGMSNPDSFWQACQGMATVNGLLARFLPFSVGSVMPTNIRPSKKKSEPPAALIAALRDLTRSRTGGNVNGLLDGSRAAKALLVPFADGAEDAYFAAKETFDKAAFAKKGRPEESIYARVVENALKIALIVAIGVDADSPEITVERLDHGLRVAEHCAETTLREISGRLADNDRQREHVDVKRMIVEAGWAGIGRRSLLQRLNGRFNERRLDEILGSLSKGSHEIVEAMRSTKGRPASRYVAVENLGAAGEC